jgi:hypothetical protein
VTTKVVSFKGSDLNDRKPSSAGFDSPPNIKHHDNDEMGFGPDPGDADVLETDRQEFYQLDSERKLRDGIDRHVIELKSFARNTVNSHKKSMDTRATDFKDGIVIPDVSDEDSLIGEQDMSREERRMSREELIMRRR